MDTNLLFALFFSHALMDYPLQNGPMPIEKNRHSNSPLQKEVPWYYWLTFHAFLHGGGVFYTLWIFGYKDVALFFGLVEFVVHWIIDFLKCDGYTNIHHDQAMHFICKIAWAVMIWKGAVYVI